MKRKDGKWQGYVTVGYDPESENRLPVPMFKLKAKVCRRLPTEPEQAGKAPPPPPGTSRDEFYRNIPEY